MAETSPRSKKDVVFIFALLVLAGGGFLCALSTFFLSSAQTHEPFYDLAPFFLGLALAAGGGAMMFLARHHYRVAWPILLITVLLWMMGASIFGFGLSAIFYYDETVDFSMNLGYVVGLCIGPGLLLAALGQLLYGFEAWRGLKQRREEETAVSSQDQKPDWLTALKSAEKNRPSVEE